MTPEEPESERKVTLLRAAKAAALEKVEVILHASSRKM